MKKLQFTQVKAAAPWALVIIALMTMTPSTMVTSNDGRALTLALGIAAFAAFKIYKAFK